MFLLVLQLNVTVLINAVIGVNGIAPAPPGSAPAPGLCHAGRDTMQDTMATP
jgi:hypothetical protein